MRVHYSDGSLDLCISLVIELNFCHASQVADYMIAHLQL